MPRISQTWLIHREDLVVLPLRDNRRYHNFSPNGSPYLRQFIFVHRNPPVRQDGCLAHIDFAGDNIGD